MNKTRNPVYFPRMNYRKARRILRRHGRIAWSLHMLGIASQRLMVSLRMTAQQFEELMDGRRG